MSMQNFLGILTSYLIYLVFVLLVTRKKMEWKEQSYSSLRLLLLFCGGYVLLELLTNKIDYVLFFAVSFAAFVYVLLIDTFLGVFGVSFSKFLFKFIFGRDDI